MEITNEIIYLTFEVVFFVSMIIAYILYKKDIHLPFL